MTAAKRGGKPEHIASVLRRVMDDMAREETWTCKRCGYERQQDISDTAEQGGRTWVARPCPRCAAATKGATT